jgi:hypothetical protein
MKTDNYEAGQVLFLWSSKFYRWFYESPTSNSDIEAVEFSTHLHILFLQHLYLILSSRPRLCLQSSLSDFPAKILYAFLTFPMYGICPINSSSLLWTCVWWRKKQLKIIIGFLGIIHRVMFRKSIIVLIYHRYTLFHLISNFSFEY